MRSLALAVLISVVTSALLFAVLVGLSFLTLTRQDTIRAQIADAVARGALNRPVSHGPFDVHRPTYHGYDCLLLGMMLAPSVNPLVDAMSNRPVAADSPVIDPRVPPIPLCQAMLRALPELKVDGSDTARFGPYDRYILGMRPLGRILLAFMSFETVGDALLWTAYGLLAATGGLALFQLIARRANSMARSRALGFLVIAACLTLFYGVWNFDRTIFFAFLDCTNFTFILIASIVPLARMRTAALALFASAYGSLIAIFEFLTGGIPFALALLPLLLALGFSGSRRDYLRKLAILWGCFCLAVVASFALKKGLALVFLGDTSSFLKFLANRMMGDFTPPPEMRWSFERWNIDLNSVRTNPVHTFLYLVLAHEWWIHVIAWGSHRLGTLLVVAAVAIVAAVIWRRRGCLLSFADPLAPACLLSLGALAAWITVFLNHTATHPFVMVRLLVIPIIAAGALLANEVAGRATRRSAAQSPPSTPKSCGEPV